MDTPLTDLPSLPPRPPAGHKGTFGTVAVFGGSCAGDARMIGAPALSARAALRSGCGLARLAMPGPILNAGIILTPSATGTRIPTDETGQIIAHEAAAVIDQLIDHSTCLAIGPGLGGGEGPTAASLRAVQQEMVPVVVDADSLNCLSQVPELNRDFRANAILTPHPGEYKRLADSLRIKLDATDPKTRPAAAEGVPGASAWGASSCSRGPGQSSAMATRPGPAPAATRASQPREPEMCSPG